MDNNSGLIARLVGLTALAVASGVSFGCDDGCALTPPLAAGVSVVAADTGRLLDVVVTCVGPDWEAQADTWSVGEASCWGPLRAIRIERNGYETQTLDARVDVDSCRVPETYLSFDVVMEPS